MNSPLARIRAARARHVSWLEAAVIPALLFAACEPGISDSRALPPGNAAPPSVVRMSAIPDFNRGKLAETAMALARYLTDAVGIPVRYEPAADYTASVNGLVANGLDLVWFGGLTTVQALDAAQGQAVLLACRDIDLQFKSYFVANRRALEAGRVRQVADLRELRPHLRDLSFTFGDKMSTSGHLMPRHFLIEAGIDPATSFRTPAAYRTAGGHGATLTAVVTGEVDVGVLNFSYYDKATPEEKDAAPVIWVTPEYVDYCFVGHARLGQDTLAKIKAALLQLDPSEPEHQSILAAWGAGRFVAAEPARWDSIRAVKNALPKDFLQ